MVTLSQQLGEKTEIIFEATGVYSTALEKFLQDHGYVYYRLNPLETKLQTATMRRNKTDKSDARDLAQTHFKINRNPTFQQDTYHNQMWALSRYYDELDEELIQL